MKQQKITIDVWVANSTNELANDDANLLNAACQAAQHAYAPYSNFNVGAALLLANGEIIKGSNQENTAYPSGLCAERVAMFYANSQYPDVPIKAIAVSSFINGQQNDQPVYPCGACRQSLMQSEIRHNQPIRVIMGGNKSIQIVESVKDLLPLTFNLNDYK